MHYFRLSACFFLCLFLSACTAIHNHVGLQAGQHFSADGSCSAVWIPYRFKDSLEDIALINKCIPYSEDQEIFMRNALEVLLRGPDEQEERGLISLVRKARVLDVKIKRGVVIVNFSKELVMAYNSCKQKSGVRYLREQWPGTRVPNTGGLTPWVEYHRVTG